MWNIKTYPFTWLIRISTVLFYWCFLLVSVHNWIFVGVFINLFTLSHFSFRLHYNSKYRKTWHSLPHPPLGFDLGELLTLSVRVPLCMFQTQSFPSPLSRDLMINSIGEDSEINSKSSWNGIFAHFQTLFRGVFTAGKHTRTAVRWSETSQQSQTGGAGGVSGRSAPRARWRTALSCFPPAPGLCVGC